jgi:hypothetical protein
MFKYMCKIEEEYMPVKNKYLILSLCIFFILSGCSSLHKEKINITDAKIVTGVDEKLMPVEVLDVFPKDTAKVSCWFKWQGAKVGTEITAKWYFITDDIHVLDYQFNIPRKEGSGSVSLAMPEGKALPSGLYRIDLVERKRVLKSLTFKVKE